MKLYTLSTKIIFLSVFMILNFTLSLHARSEDIKFHPLTIEDGLSQSSIFCIFQDSKGFMWIGTEDGLNIYDGYDFKWIKNDPESSDSLSYNYIKAICEDKSGHLWIGTYGGGLNRFDRGKKQFTHYEFTPESSNCLADNFINSVYEDQKGILWIGTENGLNEFDPEKEIFVSYRENPGNTASLSGNRVICLFEDRGGVLWIGTNNGLNKLNRETRQFTRYLHNPEDRQSLSHDFVNSICEDKNDRLWIGTQDGLNKLNREEEVFTQFKHNPDNPHGLIHNCVNSVYEDKGGTLWIGTQDGLNKLVSSEKGESEPHFLLYQAIPNRPGSLSYNEIYSIYEDRSGVLWIGTHVGLNKVDQEKKSFLHYHSRSGTNSLSHNYVRSIIEDQDGTIWIGTQDGGLNKFEREINRFTHYRANPKESSSLINDRVMSICEDRRDTIWIGTFGGLNRFDKDKERFLSFTNIPDDPTSLSSNKVRTVYMDRSGILWIGTEDGLNKFDREKEQFIRYRANADDPHSLSNNFVYSIYEDRRNTLWIGTLDGLNKFVRERGEFIHYKAESTDPQSLSNSEILSIYEDRSGRLWIGTPGGLNKFDRESEKSTYYMEKDGLPNDLIYAILEDDNGNLWLSTNKGISKFNPNAETFRNYDINDGLQSNEFITGSCLKSKTGEFFFGGINGFNIFYPDNIRDNPYIPPVVITDFQIFNKSVPIGGQKSKRSILEKSITETETIELSYKDRVISFEFAALHFASPEKNEYAYLMEGFDTDWNYVGNRRFVTYTNLTSGHYFFRVKGSNNDGIWNEKGVSLKIIITPPFSHTWWFRGLVIAGLVLIVVAIYEMKSRNIREHRKELENRVKQRTSELQREIQERKRAEQALQTEKTYLDQLFESAQEAIIMADNNHKVVRINSEFTRVFGYTSEEAIGYNIDKLVTQGKLRRNAAIYTRQMVDGNRFSFESQRHRKDGTMIYVSAIGAPIAVDNKQVGYYAIYRDITQRKKAEEDVKRRAAQASLIYKVGQRVSSELKLESLLSEIVTAVRDAFDYYGVMLLLLDRESNRLTVKSIIGGHVDYLPKDLSVAVGEGITGYVAATGRTEVCDDVSTDRHYVRKAEEIITKSEMAVPIKSANKVIGVLDIQSDQINAFDESDVAAIETLSVQIAAAIKNAHLYEQAQREISERRRAEEHLSTSLREKEVLLKEIHHRVKNNMQIISSLLRLQSSSIKNSKMQEIFKISQDRIKSMALIHEKLYQSKDLARIDFSEYIKSLTDNLLSAYRSKINPTDIKLEMVEIYVDINKAIPLGLIINELVSNSLKHAFSDWNVGSKGSKPKGKISLGFYSDGNGQLSLVVSDNGKGLPLDLDLENIDSLGLQLVNDLVRQLDGSIELKRKNGTTFKITFTV